MLSEMVYLCSFVYFVWNRLGNHSLHLPGGKSPKRSGLFESSLVNQLGYRLYLQKFSNSSPQSTDTKSTLPKQLSSMQV